MNQKEQVRLQILNSLLAEHMTVDQAAMLMGVSTRHTRRILAAYRVSKLSDSVRLSVKGKCHPGRLPS